MMKDISRGKNDRDAGLSDGRWLTQGPLGALNLSKEKKHQNIKNTQNY